MPTRPPISLLLAPALLLHLPAADAQTKAAIPGRESPSGIYGYSTVRFTPPSEEMVGYASPEFVMTVRSAKNRQLMQTLTVPENGKFTLTLPPGEYRVHVEPVRFWVDQVRLGLGQNDENYRRVKGRENEFTVRTWKGSRTAVEIYFDAGW